MLGRVAFVLKGYPRLSETFIAQEIAALERRGLEILIVSLRHPTDARRHPVHDEIRAPLLYLPEYLLPGAVARFPRLAASSEKARTTEKHRNTLAARSRARPDAEPHPPLRPGAGAGERTAAGRAAPARAFPAHAGLGHALRGAAAWARLDGFGARQGHLDHAGVGEAREARVLRMAGHLHRGEPCAPGGARAAGPGGAGLSRTGFFPVSFG